VIEHAAWLSKLTTPNGNITCKLDTGAGANALPISELNKLAVISSLQPTAIRLTAYGASTINPIGTCELHCEASGSYHKVKFYVVDVNSHPILGLKDYEKLDLIKRMDAIHTGQLIKESIKALYKNVFTGLGKLGQYHIALQSDCKLVVCPPRCVPYSLKGHLQKAI